jgi:hypothetical protein
MKKKAFMGIMLLVAAMILSAGGTCFAAVANTSLLQPESGVSFAPGICVADIDDYGQSGAGFSGGTVYVASGGIVNEDMSGVWTGSSIWQVRSDGLYAEFIAGNPYSWFGFFTGVMTGVTYSGLGSLTCVPSSGNGGVSVWGVINNYRGWGTATAGCTGFTVGAMSHDSQNRITAPYAAHNLSGQSDVGVLNSPAYSSNWMQNSTTVSGDSLFIVTSAVSGQVNPGGGGSTIYSLRANTVNADADTADPNNVVAYRVESRISGFACSPVIKEGISGISLFVLGALGPQNASGVSLLGYQGANFAAIANAAPPQINYRIDPLGSTYTLGPNTTAVTLWPTPALGEGRLAWGRNNYSGNSLFVTDGLGGVSVFDLTTLAANTTQAQVAALLRFYPYSNDQAASSVTPIPGPVTNGQYLVLPSATGVSIYESDTQGITLGSSNSNSFVAGYEFTVAAGYDTQNWYTSSTPAISNGFAIVPITSNRGATVGEFRQDGRIIFIRLLDGVIMETFNTNQGVIAPIAVASNLDGNYVWAVDYNSTVYQIEPETLKLEADEHWYQFKFGPGKSGNNTEIELDDVDFFESSGGCFISTIK